MPGKNSFLTVKAISLDISPFHGRVLVYDFLGLLHLIGESLIYE